MKKDDDAGSAKVALALFCKVCERREPAAICPDHLELLENTAAELLRRLPLIARTVHGQRLWVVLRAGGVDVRPH